jgi:hypothetical protein
MNWCRECNPHEPQTNHHPRCEYVNETLIDVWRVSLDGTSYFTDEQPNKDDTEGVTVAKLQMHREVYEHLPEFAGF